MKNIDQRIDAVKNDREHGSRWLVRETLLIMRDLAQTQEGSQHEQMQRLYETGRTLAHAHPAMAALTSAVGRVLHVQGGPSALGQEAERLLREYDEATSRIAAYAEPLLYGTLITCSISGTVLDVLVHCRQHIQRVVALEGRPRYEGRAMAKALSQQGLAVTLITDAEAAIFLPHCNSVVVGADSVLADGDVLNKAGTALLGWAARGYEVPFYVLCETLKISTHRWSDDPERQAENRALLEEKEPEEVLADTIQGVEVHNFYFDRTPYKLITKFVTEQGILEQAAIQEIVKHIKDV